MLLHVHGSLFWTSSLIFHSHLLHGALSQQLTLHVHSWLCCFEVAEALPVAQMQPGAALQHLRRPGLPKLCQHAAAAQHDPKRSQLLGTNIIALPHETACTCNLNSPGKVTAVRSLPTAALRNKAAVYDVLSLLHAVAAVGDEPSLDARFSRQEWGQGCTQKYLVSMLPLIWSGMYPALIEAISAVRQGNRVVEQGMPA